MHNPETTFVLPGGAEIEMVWIEPGTFTMGTTEAQEETLRSKEMWEDWMDREQPAHSVTITQGFYLGKYELTQGQWESVMGTTPWSGEEHVVEAPNHPAVFISWEYVQAFITKLNEAESLQVYRLPTEAEWEYACRAGTTTRWSCGNNEGQLGNYAWYRGNASGVGEVYGHEVGTKLSNPWGLYDMHGNVWEWCQDRYGAYSSDAQTDPTGPTTGSDRVIRGGYFTYIAQSTRSAFRSYSSPGSRYSNIGARLLRQGP